MIVVEVSTETVSARIKTDAAYSPDIADDLVRRIIDAARDTLIHTQIAAGAFDGG